MGDSDEDYNDSRRRDKFVRERNDYSSNRNNLSNSSNWQSNDNNWQQQDRSNNRNQVQRTDSFGRRERYSSPGYDMPSNKRSRPNSNNWNEDRSNYSQPSYDSYESFNVNQNQNDNTLTQPPMMSFKQFMRGLDDSIDHLEAAKKYNEYKFDFKRKQILEFFTAHKDEEWFRIKYHPIESVFRKKQLRGYVRYRAKVFFDLNKSELIDSTFIDIEKSDKITNVLDSAVIKLEGGTDFDLKCLDSKKNVVDSSKDDQIDFINENNKSQEGGRNIIIVKPEGYIKDSNENSMNENEISEKTESESMDIKENKSDETSENVESDFSKDEKLESEENKNESEEADTSENQTNKEADESVEKIEDQDKNQDNEKAIDDADVELDEDTGPRPLHKTSSIFLRYLPANITKVEIENMFKLYPQYLRVALADPAFDKRFQRRGWVTFNRNVDIRRIYLSLNNVRIRDCEVGAIINRDLSRRIRSVNGIASHRLNVLADLKHTSKIILNLDEEKKIWESEEDEQGNVLEGLEEPITLFGYQTKNPILKDVENCFKETSSEESSVIDDTGEIKEDNDEEAKPLERDDNLIKVLDKLIFYLRIVHSLDYYNHIDYPNEDEMPNRIGIMHARGMAPTANITLKEVNDYIRQFETKIASYLERNVPLNDEELEKLGKKKIEDEIEKFISDNTKEIKKELWFCPLSKKKFKGPNYVKKHIETKHADKLEEVKKDTEFFNSYLADARRPQLPEHPFNRTGNKQQSNDNYSSNFNNSQSNYGNVHQRINFGGPNGGNNYNNGNRYNNYRNGSGNKFNNRKRIYRDLDAPVDDY